MSNKSLETLFQIITAVLIGVAAFFLWSGNYEGVFISSVLSSVSYFLSYRFQLKEKMDIRDAEEVERELEESIMNRNILRENAGLFEVENIDINEEKEDILVEK
jgi:hypothetical protein